MLIGIEGGLGDGKTVLMTKYLKGDADKGFPVLCNYKLFNIKHKPLIVEEMLEKEQTDVSLKNVTIGVDEITVFADCRLSGSRLNRLFSYLILQSRKRSVDIYFTTQDFTMIDKRIYAHTHIYIISESLYDAFGEVIDDIKKYTLIDCRNKRYPRTTRFLLDIKHWYDYYDTDEIIKPPILKKPDKKK